MNTTGERVFGYDEAEVRDRRLDLLIPSLASPAHRRARRAGRDGRGYTVRPRAARDPRPASQRNLVRRRDRGEQGAARPALGLHRVPARHHGPQARRGGYPRKRGALSHAGRKRPEAIVVLDTDAGHFVECNDNAVRFFKMSREELLARDRSGSVRPSSRTGRRRSASRAATSIAHSRARRRASSGCTATRTATTSPAKSAWSGCRRPAGG